MIARLRRLSLPLAATAILVLGAGGAHSQLQKQVKFGIESAKKGLWNEAIFRWERALDINPHSAILLNNIAVAYETLGRYDEAADQYEKALQYGHNRYPEIRQNYQRFMGFYSAFRQAQQTGAAGGSGSGDGGGTGGDDE